MNIKVGTVYIDVEPDVSQFSEKLRRKLQDTDLGKAVEQTLDKATRSTVNFRKETDRTSVSLDRIGNKTANFNVKMLALRNVVSLIKIPALFAALNLAAQAMVALTAGATAAVSALGPLAGLIVTLPAGLLAIGAAAITVKLAFSGMGAALKGTKGALEKLGPAGQEFVLFLQTLKPLKDNLKEIAASNLLPGIQRGMLSAFSAENISAVQTVIAETANSLGGIATKLGQALRSSEFSKALLTISETSVRAFDAIGDAMITFGAGLGRLVLAAQPLIRWLTDVVAKGLELVGVWFSNASASGRAAKFFQETADVTYLLGKILGRLFGTLAAIGRAAYPLGKVILVALNNELGKLLEWARSASGQASLRGYFESAVPVLKAFVLLAAALVKTIFDVGQAAQNSGLAGFFDQIRTEVLPLFAGAASGAGGLGQALLDVGVAAGKFVAIFLSASGPLTVFAKAVAGVAKSLASLVANNPLLAEFLTTFLALAGLSKLFNLTGVIRSILATIASLQAMAASATVAGTAMTRLNYAMRANIIGIIVTAVQLLVVGFILLYRRSETFRTAVNKLFSFLRDVGVVVIKVLTLQLRIMLRAMEAMFEVASHLPFVGDKFKGVAEKIHTVRGALDGAITALGNVGKSSTDAGSKVNDMATKTSGSIVKLGTVVQGLSTKLKTSQAGLQKLGEGLAETFKNLSEKALKAFDADTANLLDKLSVRVQTYGQSWTFKEGDLTPAERELKALDEVERKRSAMLRRAQINKDLALAKRSGTRETELDGKIITTTVTPDKEKVLQLNEELRQLDLDDKRRGLEARAVVEKAAAQTALETGRRNLQAERDVKREGFEKELTALQESISKGKLTQQRARAETLALLAKYGVSLRGAGQRLGNAFAGSLNKSMQAVQAQAGRTNAALTKILTLRKEIDAYERKRKKELLKEAAVGRVPDPFVDGLSIRGTGAQVPAPLRGDGMVVGQYVQFQTVSDESSAREIASTAARKVARR